MGRTSRLSICHLGKYYPPAAGGIETHVQTLARAQAELGARVRVACINHMDRHGRDVTWARYGATRTTQDMDGRVTVTRLGRSATVARLDIIPGLPRLLEDLQYGDIDLLHLHAPNPTMMVAAATLRLNIPLVITHHSDVIRQKWLRYVYLPFERLAYARAASILCSSPTYVEGSALLQQHVDKVETLPMGLDLAPYAHPTPAATQHAQELRRRYGENIWLCVGRCVYYKGLHTAIAALAHVPGVLIIVGNGPLEKDLRDFARRVGVADRVVWWGYATVDELIGAYQASNALWFPSSHKSEAFGLVQVEAMASGTPVINTRIPGSGVAWVSPHDESGLTVPINDPHALAAAANRLVNEPGLRDRLADAARRRAADEFDHRTMAERSLAAYERAVARAKKIVAGHEAASPKLRNWIQDVSATGMVNASLAPVRRELVRRDRATADHAGA